MAKQLVYLTRSWGPRIWILLGERWSSNSKWWFGILPPFQGKYTVDSRYLELAYLK